MNYIQVLSKYDGYYQYAGFTSYYKKVNLFPVPRNAEYSLKPNPTKVSSTYIRKLIEQQTIDVSEKDLELNPIQGGNQ
mgnify:CR=1 FL=1